MLVRTHIIFALLCTVLYLQWFSTPNKIIFVIIAICATLLPDLDETNSTLGRKLKPVSFFIKLFFGHRGIWHSLWIPLLIYILFSVYLKGYAMAVVIGYTAHLISDSLTIEGINFLYPLQFQLKGFIKTGNVVEQIFALLCVIAIVYFLIH